KNIAPIQMMAAMMCANTTAWYNPRPPPPPAGSGPVGRLLRLSCGVLHLCEHLLRRLLGERLVEERQVDLLFLVEVHAHQRVEAVQHVAQFACRLHGEGATVHLPCPRGQTLGQRHDLLVVAGHRCGGTWCAERRLDGRAEHGSLSHGVRNQELLDEPEDHYDPRLELR